MESDKSELNMTQMILTQFFSEITYDKDSDEFSYIPTGDYISCGMTGMSYIMKQQENAINIMMKLMV